MFLHNQTNYARSPTSKHATKLSKLSFYSKSQKSPSHKLWIQPLVVSAGQTGFVADPGTITKLLLLSFAIWAVVSLPQRNAHQTTAIIEAEVV